MEISSPQARCLKARYVLPVTTPPIPGGVVTIVGDRIAEVGAKPAGEEVEDLGNAVVLPGLVNAHTHLEFSDLAKPLGEPGIGFVDWIRRVVAQRLQRDDRSQQPVKKGLRESIRNGTTTLGEIARPGWPVEQFDDARFDATVFLELIAMTSDRVAAALELAQRHLAAAKSSSTWHPGLSPHAPYSVHPELLAALVSLSAAGGVPVAFHLAESPEELELLRDGSGPFRELLDELAAWDPNRFPPGTRPLNYLHTLAGARRSLIVHGNYLDDEEIALLAEHRRQMAVVYCPRTHIFFQHESYPLGRMLAAGVTVALGTDSRASSPDLNLLAEMRSAAARHPDVAPETILRMGTILAAEALGRQAEVGSLEPGKVANLAVVALPDHHAADPHELLFSRDQPVIATWRRGRKDQPGPEESTE